ncbi:hypothetical protein HU200_031260 [Digitaria exilis]|uniref:Uncharacterized protein n=1 Tax=Digitaria exilis TaxID=1010633 RepID=A0A835C1T1_9POAL|nr:hypothetical protein HU200_031260 [Digitaria exilis]CAB3476296.1 unnamed protein product [Digitaria exilis]
MPMPFELNDSNIAGEFVDAAAGGASDDAAASRQLARLLLWVGSFTMLLDQFTALYRAPSGVVFQSHKLAYYLTLAAIFAFGVAEVITAFALTRHRSNGSVQAFARVVLYISVMPLVGAIAVGGFAVFMKT